MASSLFFGSFFLIKDVRDSFSYVLAVSDSIFSSSRFEILSH